MRIKNYMKLLQRRTWDGLILKLPLYSESDFSNIDIEEQKCLDSYERKLEDSFMGPKCQEIQNAWLVVIPFEQFSWTVN